MFIELDVWNAKTVAFRPTTINTDNIDEFYPDMIEQLKTIGTKIWILEGNDQRPVLVRQTYQEVRTLLANVSLLVNE